MNIFAFDKCPMQSAQWLDDIRPQEQDDTSSLRKCCPPQCEGFES